MKSRFSLSFPLAAAVGLLLLVSGRTFGGPVSTTTIDFSNYTDNGPRSFNPYEVFSDGFAFFADGFVSNACGVPCLIAGPSHGVSELSMFPYSPPVPMNSDGTTFSNGTTFSLFSFAAAEPAYTIPGEGIGAQWLTVEAIGSPQRQSYTFQLTDQLALFDVNFLNVQEVDFMPFYVFPNQLTDEGFLDLTNLVVSQPSPEPASLPSSLVGFGFLGLVAAALHRYSRTSNDKAVRIVL